ncbi:MAG: protein kinase [bacterium]
MIYDDDNTPNMVGTQIGNYNATKLLGKGSMGEVYQATHPILDKEVAIKVLSEELFAYPELVSRFKREARAIARIKHKAIVQAFDFGNLEDGRQYYVMELLKGSNLAVYMAAKGPLPWKECEDIALPLLEGLAAAHEAGFIHRDIKPDNIFLTRLEDGTLYPKIIDFGIAKLKNQDEQQDSVVTRIDAVMGTPLYMSPEQAPGSTESVGPWSDIYSAAATLYHMIAGKPPFYSDNPLELMLMHSWQPPSPLFEERSDLSLEISDAIMKALAKKPADRYQSMAAFAEGLKAAALAAAKPRPATVATPSTEGDEATTDTAETPTEAPAKAGADEPAAAPETPAAAPPATGRAAETRALPATSKSKSTDEPPPKPTDETAPADEAASTDETDSLEALAADRPPKPVLTSLSGAASEKIITARLPTGTYFVQKKSKLPYILVAVVVLAILAGALYYFVAAKGSKKSTSAQTLPFRLLSSKARHTCGLERDQGTVWCWGRNNYGQLGTGDTQTRRKPARVGSLKAVSAVAAGGRHSCALEQNGKVWCWGRNNTGQLGDGSKKNRHAPVLVAGIGPAAALDVGSHHSCALLRDGSVWCWGDNRYGQLGNGARDPGKTRPVRVAGLRKAAQLAVGGFHACAVDTEGHVWCWGRNDVGQLGIGSTEAQPSPKQLTKLSAVKSITAAGAHTCGVDAKGGAWCWGNNASGQLGDTTSRLRFEPVKVVGLSAVSTLSAGGGYLGGHTCATDTRGNLYCWGNNLSGQLGHREPADAHQKPQRLERIGGIVARVEAGGRHTCAILQSGEVRCWGRNTDGQLGDGTLNDRPYPTKIKP